MNKLKIKKGQKISVLFEKENKKKTLETLIDKYTTPFDPINMATERVNVKYKDQILVCYFNFTYNSWAYYPELVL